MAPRSGFLARVRTQGPGIKQRESLDEQHEREPDSSAPARQTHSSPVFHAVQLSSPRTRHTTKLSPIVVARDSTERQNSDTPSATRSRSRFQAERQVTPLGERQVTPLGERQRSRNLTSPQRSHTRHSSVVIIDSHHRSPSPVAVTVAQPQLSLSPPQVLSGPEHQLTQSQVSSDDLEYIDIDAPGVTWHLAPNPFKQGSPQGSPPQAQNKENEGVQPSAPFISPKRSRPVAPKQSLQLRHEVSPSAAFSADDEEVLAQFLHLNKILHDSTARSKEIQITRGLRPPVQTDDAGGEQQRSSPLGSPSYSGSQNQNQVQSTAVPSEVIDLLASFPSQDQATSPPKISSEAAPAPKRRRSSRTATRNKAPTLSHEDEVEDLNTDLLVKMLPGHHERKSKAVRKRPRAHGLSASSSHSGEEIIVKREIKQQSRSKARRPSSARKRASAATETDPGFDLHSSEEERQQRRIELMKELDNYELEVVPVL
ncbi:hypothetical protein OIO90_001389 [Microbotryomycetes sp. JL221]|nr:hypothetical protein OIO90_001389 [Microbotryomycetes sp. JL221]